MLLATLQNNSGSPIGQLTISYTQTSYATDVTEQVPAHRVYFSLTGEPGSWQVIPGLSSQPDGNLSASIATTGWSPGANLYILWVDDNANPGTDPAYTIDSVSFNAVGASGPLQIVNPNLPQSLGLQEYDRATFQFVVSGQSPSFQWYKNGQPIPGANNANFTINSVTPADAGQYYCVASNPVPSVVTSRVAVLNVAPDEIKPAVATVSGVGAAKVRVVFSEAVRASTATNAGNYTVFLPSGGGSIAVQSVTLLNTNTVELTLAAPRQYAVEYYLTVRNVQDLAQTPNTIFTQTETIPAEYNMPIFQMNHVWKYNTNGTDLGTAWRNVGYNDADWPSGQGILGFEDSAATLAAFAAAGESVRTDFGSLTGRSIPTYYFRTTFTNTNTISGLGLMVEGWIDDGAIFFLNGVEVGRWTSPGTWTDPVVFTSLVSAAASPEGTVKTVVLDATPLRFGENTLAVEVHQNSLTSSDVVLGIRLNQVIPAPLAITQQPQGTNIFDGQTLTLTVGYSGSLPRFQWYRNGVPVAGANSATYSVASAVTNDSGNYYVVITNGISAVTSATVNVTVRVDNIPPAVYGALMQTNGFDQNWGDACVVQIAFTEPVNTNDAVNLANYFIVRQGDATNVTLQIFQATIDASGTNLTLICAPKQETSLVNYSLYIGNIRDRAAAQNVMTRTNLFMFQRHYLVKSQTQAWRYNASGQDLGTAWIAPTFNDSAWDQAYTPFVDESYQNTIPNGWGAPSVYIPVSNTITSYYYRTTFNLPVDPAGVRLQFEIWADDGCVMYLNGTELRSDQDNANNPGGRYYMTNGTEQVRATTLAQNHAAGTPSQRAPLYPVNLRNGQNTLAVSVHQSANDMGGTTQDHAFAIQVIATVPPLNQAVRPSLVQQPANITTNLGATVTFRPVGDGTLPLTAVWYFNTNTPIRTNVVASGTAITNIPNLIALTLNNVTGANEGTYTLVLQNSAGVVTSTVATLTVLRPPTFLVQPTSVSAAVGSNVTFTAQAEGTLPLRYQWYFNGVNRLVGETNATLTLLNVQTEQAGNYSVVVTNSVGAVTSQVATLTVIGGQATPPNIPRGSLVYRGPGNNFSLQVPTQAGFTYRLQWNLNVEDRNGWQNVPGATVSGDGSVRTLTDINPAGPRRFYRIAVD
ncbi:immunoglobulin domain-containing protein [Fontisphaera persica]|uniref:immunoglobulin domain-containing protein n=1 Tax=Fontisphaera persica TaxID=2974023 RepID=UPI0024C051A7|nr:immunoglobulin domain-containing protein [Fontisphaera persica]WCJ59826.1 immunoglobulin domain-containing protein [Fontisphaera persica]